jgi:hypothetical protein
MRSRSAASFTDMVATIDIDTLLEQWATRISATAALAPDPDEATAAVKRMRLRLAIELSPRAQGWCPGFPAPPASADMRREFIKLVFRDARKQLADDDSLALDAFVAAERTLSAMERRALSAYA